MPPNSYQTRHFYTLVLSCLAALVMLLSSTDASAACEGLPGVGGVHMLCGSRAEAEALALDSVSPGIGHSERLVTVGPTEYTIPSGPHAGRVAEGYVRPECYEGGTVWGCGYGSAVYGWWFKGNACTTKEGESYEAWQYTAAWPPVSGGCGQSGCKVTHQIISSPMPSPIEGQIIYRARSTYTGDECGIDDEPTDEVDEEDLGDGWKCDPKTGMCTDPDGNGKLCTFNPDGSRSACVDYKPGDGTEPKPEDPEKPDDPRDEESVSGGGSCDVAPACTGKNKIGCASLWQQWKTRCAVEKAGTTIGSNATCSNRLSTGYACIGDAATCGTLNNLHAIRCSIDGLSNVGDGGASEGDPDPNGKAAERAAIDAAGQGGDGLDGITPADAWANNSGSSGVGTGLFGGGGGCPTFPAVTVGNSTFTAPPQFCSIVAMIRLLFLAVAYIWALKIVGD